MGFQILRAEERTARMVQWFSGICQKVTDFLPGSKIRTKFEALAVELEAQDFAFYQAAKKAIPIAVYQAFDFSLLAATKATGAVLFTADQAPVTDVVIPKGTRIATQGTPADPEKLYETSKEVILLAGYTSVQAPITSLAVGQAGNAGSNNILVIKGTLAGITGVTNPTALVNGADKETENERRFRFIEYIAALRRGTNEAIESGAKTATITDESGIVTERAMSALVDEAWGEELGNIACYIFNGNGNTSDALVARAQQIIDGYENPDGTRVGGYKAAGITCTVLKAVERPPNVNISITALPGYDQAQIKVQAEEIIATYLKSLDIGDKCIANEIIERVMTIDGVYNCNLIEPAGDLIAEPQEVFTPYGFITVTVS
jgi:uncharacterized phage protein gp47/JayE